MNGQTDIWQFLAGLGFFLYGMHLIDATIRKMEGRGFKVFLKKNTSTRRGSLMSGFVVTAILQSSSIVNLLLLSFSGAGLVGLRNALGVVLGSNIGGTVNSWLVAVLGFSVDLGSYALVLTAIAGIGLFLVKETTRYYRILTFCMGFGLVLLGLDYAKTSMDGVLSTVNLGQFEGYNRMVFVVVGFGITALVQTSAATVMIVLSALYAQAIPLQMAVAIVLGAELGTTLKIVLGAAKGPAVKRRIAAGNLLLNLTSTAIGIIFLAQVIDLLEWTGLRDPLFLLVAFQSAVNIAGAVIFYFLLDPLANLLNRFFKDDEQAATKFLPMASPELPEPAVGLLEKETHFFLLRALTFAVRFFGIDASHLPRKYLRDALRSENAAPAITAQYPSLKAGEDEMIAFSARLQKAGLKTEATLRIHQLLISVRHGMYAAKALKDIEHNIRALKSSANEYDFRMYQHFRDEMQAMMDGWLRAWNDPVPESASKELDKLMALIEKDHQEDASNIYRQSHMNAGEPSTLLNVNREMYNSGKSMIAALRELLQSRAGLLNDSVTSRQAEQLKKT